MVKIEVEVERDCLECNKRFMAKRFEYYCSDDCEMQSDIKLQKAEMLEA